MYSIKNTCFYNLLTYMKKYCCPENLSVKKYRQKTVSQKIKKYTFALMRLLTQNLFSPCDN